MKRNIIRIILILIIIILVLVAAFIIIKVKKTKTELDNKPYIIENNIEPISEEVIIPNNSYKFFGKYTNGDITSKEIYEQIYQLTSVSIPKYYKELANKSNEYIIEYYEKNEDKIKKDSLIFNNSMEFQEFINTIKFLSEDFIVEYEEFEVNSIVKNKDCVTAKMIVKYKDNSKISFFINVMFEKKENGIVFYKFNS